MTQTLYVRPKFFAFFASVMFLGVLIEHGTRLYFHFDVFYAGVHVPLWFSALVSALSVMFIFAAFRQAK